LLITAVLHEYVIDSSGDILGL